MLDEIFANLISLHCTRSFICDIMILRVYDLVFFKTRIYFFCPREKNTFYNEGMEYKPSEARES